MYYVIAILFFLSVNHFAGFIQDCIPYTLQAIDFLEGGRFVDDPGFMFGSQGAFSIFDPFYSLFIISLGVDKGALVFTFLIHISIALSAAVFVKKWCRLFKYECFSLPVLIVFFALFAYNEPRCVMWTSIKTIEAFPVARSLSVCFGFLGGFCLLSKRKWTSLILFLVGTGVHPLTVGWCIPVWLFAYYPKTRKPITIMSILLPLTVFFERGFFAPFPKEWLNISFQMNGVGKVVCTLLEYCAFFGLALKVACSKRIKMIIQVVLLTVGIAFFWFVASVFTKHIFLFQVQTFRVEWLCHVMSILVYSKIFFDIYVSRIRKHRTLVFWEKFFLLVGVALWVDSAFITCLAIAFVLSFYLKEKKSKLWLNFLLLVYFVGTVYLIYGSLCIFHQKILEFMGNSATFLQYGYGLIAALAVVLKVNGKCNRLIVDLILSLCIVVAAYGANLFPVHNFAIAYLIAAMVFPFTRFYTQIISILVMVVCIYLGYDVRNENQKRVDSVMNQFVEKPPFSYIKARGRVLYATEKYGARLPRIAFLSGAYYDSQYDVSSLFFEGMEVEVSARSQKLYYGTESNGLLHKLSREIIQDKIYQALSNKDSLESRTSYLCQIGEITHLVADRNDLNLLITDSLLLERINSKVYLYSCNM